jgi:hypothetical protein
MATILEQPSTITLSESDSQFVIPADTVWSNSSHFISKQYQLLSQPLHANFGGENTGSLLLKQVFRPEVGPSKRRRCSKAQSPGDIFSPERARYLERNRVASNKCRLRKKHEQLKIQHALDDATSKPNALLAEVNRLKEEVWQLKSRVLAHAKCGDRRINLQLMEMRQKYYKSRARCDVNLHIFRISYLPMGRWEMEQQPPTLQPCLCLWRWMAQWLAPKISLTSFDFYFNLQTHMKDPELIHAAYEPCSM